MSSRTPNKIKSRKGENDVVVSFNGVVAFERTQRVIATVNGEDTRPADHEITMLEWWANKGHMGASMIDVVIAMKGKHIVQSEPWEVADKVKNVPAVPVGLFSLEEARIIYDSAVNLFREARLEPYTAFMDFLNSGKYRR